ncbi:MAG: hypothetical protein C0448_01105 [Sphingobacteriaceae bacterium]|nr:hypothetical protein [Sphingobacteriaceae bacterium]
MQENNIKPEKITKPIQLLAAWLIGLVLLESSLLTAAGTIDNPSWLPAFFGISAVTIIPLFLLMIFLLQTKFRPEMQEDSFYSKYLDRNTMTFEPIDKIENKEIEISKLKEEILEISSETKANLENINQILKKETITNQSKEISQIINDSDKKIEELKNLAKYTSIDLRINKNLKEYNKIVDAILKLGFPKYIEFGSKPIDKFVVAFGKNIPTSIVRDIIFELLPLGLQHIKLTKTVPKEVHADDTIYIGSYLINDNKIEIDNELINKLKNAPENQKFSEFI